MRSGVVKRTARTVAWPDESRLMVAGGSGGGTSTCARAATAFDSSHSRSEADVRALIRSCQATAGAMLRLTLKKLSGSYFAWSVMARFLYGFGHKAVDHAISGAHPSMRAGQGRRGAGAVS